jgi:hypothetical protein
MAMNFLGGLSPYGSMGDDNLGAGRRHPRHGGHAQHRLPHGGNPLTEAAHERANRAAGFTRPDIPGAPSRDAAILPAGWPPFAFAAALGINSQNQQMNVQTPFRGQRLTAIIVRNGASAFLTAPVISTLIVGQKPIIASASPVAAENFVANAFDTNLMFPPTYPGIIYSMNMNLVAALAGTDTVLALMGVNGSALL